jgi:phenylacetaldehyde dehydrogenase
MSMTSAQPAFTIPRITAPQLMLINGKWIPAKSGKVFDVRDPSTGQVIAQVPDGQAEDIDLAVQTAAQAFRDRRWMKLGNAQRAKILWRIGDLIEKNLEELIPLESYNNGMPVQIVRWVVGGAAEMFRYYAGWCTKIAGESFDLTQGEQHVLGYTRREPVGVAGLITPWNAPISLASTKIATALAAGCTCVLKPAEETPLTALRLGELLMEAGVPDGVVNIVTGFGHTAGAALTAHPRVDKISFTGSGEVGKIIVKAAADNLKKVSLELGGKSPVIALDDLDIEQAVPGMLMGAYVNSGQVCIVGSRLYAHRKVFDKLVEGIADAAQGMKIGPALDPDTQLGPLVSAKQLERVQGYIDIGKKDGASLVIGGNRIGDAGYYMAPTIFANPKPDSAIVREEIFGPVLSVMRFDDLNDVIDAANNTTYGLGASVWTRDISKAHRIAERLNAGMVWINTHLLTDPSMPFGGFKQSGWGKEMGREGLDAFLQTKSVFAKL